MKILNLLLLAGIVVSPAYAQSSSDEETVVQQQRPVMPSLFFRKEQRRVLEAVRQGVVEEEDFQIEEFVPVVIIEEALPEVEEVNRTRSAEIYYGAYIVNHGSGKKVVWMNGEQIDITADAELLQEQGLSVSIDTPEKGLLNGNDEFSRGGFEVRVGQIIGVDGSIEETLPVVSKKQ